MAGLAPAAGATPAQTKVSPFRSPFRSGRVVVIRYTRFARHRRFAQQVLYGPPLDRAVCEIADQLDRHPGELSAVAVNEGVIAICARMRPNAPADLKPGTSQTLAMVKGITAAEFAVAAQEIQRPNFVLVAR